MAAQSCWLAAGWLVELMTTMTTMAESKSQTATMAAATAAAAAVDGGPNKCWAAPGKKKNKWRQWQLAGGGGNGRGGRRATPGGQMAGELLALADPLLVVHGWTTR